MSDTVILHEVGGHDSKPFAVGRIGEAYEGRWKRKVLFIDLWCETEDEARAYRDRSNRP